MRLIERTLPLGAAIAQCRAGVVRRFPGAAGALGGKPAGGGIGDGFSESVEAKVTPGTSALFPLSEGAVVGRVREAFSQGHAELIRSDPDRAREEKLREVFAG
ncbi:DUF1269 domain-containing protein [Streptomyces termitum]